MININRKQDKMLKDMDFYHQQEKIKKNKYWIKDQIDIDVPKKVVHKAGKFIGNKIADAITKSNDDNIEKQEPVEEIIISPEKREEILNKLRRVL